MFQSTPPHGRRLEDLPCESLPTAFQSTPPHGRRRCIFDDAYRALGVSIHASAREATRLHRHRHAQRRGFNPRLRTGGDMSQN